MNTERNPVGWFELYVNDLARARTFYEKTFELRLEELETPANLEGPSLQMLAFPMRDDAPGAAGALVRMEGMEPGCAGTLIYFSCADCAREAGRAAENGGRIEREKFSIGQYGFIAMVRDTEGNLIGLHSMQ